MRELLLFLSTPLLTFIFATAFLVIWGRERQRYENLALSLGWFLLGSGFCISLLSPDHWGRVIIAMCHAPYTLSACALSWGVLTRVGAKPPLKAHLWIALAGFGVLMLVQNIGDSVTADLYVTNLTVGAIMTMTAQLFAQRAGRDIVERFILIMLILTAAQCSVRPVLSMMFDGPIAAEAYRQTVYYLAFYWVFAFGSVLFGLSLIAGAVKDQFGTLRLHSSTDALSGLFVRGEFEARVEAALTKARTEGKAVSLVIGDIDHLKQVNDIWGHQIGDGAIAAFGAMAKDMIRDTDIIGRIGGEEFCILVWDADERVAEGLAERLRVRTGELVVGDSALDVRLTASFGVAQRRKNESYRSLFARADAALYASKQAGRDQVSRASDCGEPIPANTPARLPMGVQGFSATG